MESISGKHSKYVPSPKAIIRLSFSRNTEKTNLQKRDAHGDGDISRDKVTWARRVRKNLKPLES